MRSRSLMSLLLLLTVLAAGCSSIKNECAKAYVKCNPLAADPRSPEVTRTFTPVKADALPAELVSWKEMKPVVRPGGTSAVAGEWRYVMASFGTMDYANYAITITDVQVLEKRVKVQAYFHMTSADSVQQVAHPKDFAKVPYEGGDEELPVELVMKYDSAAYAYIPQPFDQVDPLLLPKSLSSWTSSNEPTQTAVVGDYLYVMINAGEQYKPRTAFALQSLALDGPNLRAVTALTTLPDGVNLPTSQRVYGRLLYRGDQMPKVHVEFQTGQW